MKINTFGKGVHVEVIVKEEVRNPKGLAKWQQTKTGCGVKLTSKRDNPDL